MDKSTEEPRAQVPLLLFGEKEMAQQAREIRCRWQWVEQTIWTTRMLKALENGVKGGKWFRLVDKVYAGENLKAAFAKVKANKGAPGVDRQTIEMFELHLEANLEKLAQDLREDTYRPGLIKREWIPKPGSNEKRPLGIPGVRDRIAQTALRNVLDPIFERDFHKNSYGFRPGRSCKDALRHVNLLLNKKGYRWVVDADLKSYFDTIPHDKLMERVAEKVADGRILSLIQHFLKQGVLDGEEQWNPESGTPQGAVISPLLSNIFLDPLDQMMAREGHEMIRYADDFVILCRSKEEAEKALKRIQDWAVEAGLVLHPQKTRIVYVHPEEPKWPKDDSSSFDFLGFTFWRNKCKPREKSLTKVRNTIRDKTPRNSGKSLEAIIKDVNGALRGWFEYFKHSVKSIFPDLDKLVCRRLRSILMRRRKSRNRGRGRTCILFSNAYFAAAGLQSLAARHAACQSSRR